MPAVHYQERCSNFDDCCVIWHLPASFTVPGLSFLHIRRQQACCA